MKAITSVIFVCTLLTGCAFGQKTNYHEGETEFETFVDDKSQTLFLGFHDARPYVLSGEKDASFSGLVRSLYGIPYPRHTASGKPLDDDLTEFMVRSLTAQGYSVQPIHLDLREEVEPALRSAMNGNSVGLIYRIQEWKTDSMHREVFIYDVTLDVYNSSVELVANVTDSGRRRIDSNFRLSDAIKELLDRIHKQPAIQQAINIQ